MKKLIVILSLTTLTACALGQGLVNFLNNPTTLISVNGAVLPSGYGGSFWFALLAAPSGSTDPHTFTFTGAYATNQNVAGRMAGGIGLAVYNWAAGETKAFYVVGWSADNGTVFNPAWIAPGSFHTPYGDFAATSRGYFAVSPIAPAGVAGGGPQSLPNLVVFGGSQGIQSGLHFIVPEPSTLALAALGMTVLAISTRRKREHRFG